MDWGDKGKECNRISGVDTRTYARLEAKARIMATNGEKKKSCGEGGKVEITDRKRREKTHQPECPNNERG